MGFEPAIELNWITPIGLR